MGFNGAFFKGVSESNIFEIAIVDIINPFVPNAPFLYPLKISENHKMG